MTIARNQHVAVSAPVIEADVGVHRKVTRHVDTVTGDTGEANA